MAGSSTKAHGTVLGVVFVVFVGCILPVVSCTTEDESPPEVADELRAKLLAAVSANRTTEVRDLLSRGADPNSLARTHAEETALSIAAQFGYVETAQALLDKHAHVNLRNGGSIDGYTPLMMAAHQGHPEMVEVLFNAGADVNMRSGIGGTGPTALSLAVLENQTGSARRLLGGGAIVQLHDFRTALESGSVKMVELLLEAGANPFGPLPGGIAPGSTPLQIASRLQQPIRSQMIEMLSRLMKQTPASQQE